MRYLSFFPFPSPPASVTSRSAACAAAAAAGAIADDDPSFLQHLTEGKTKEEVEVERKATTKRNRLEEIIVSFERLFRKGKIWAAFGLQLRGSLSAGGVQLIRESKRNGEINRYQGCTMR